MTRREASASSGLFEKQFPTGTVLFREGDTSRELYILLSGRVLVSKAAAEITDTRQPGSYFGEISALLGSPRTATVATLEESRLLVVEPDRLTHLFRETPEFGLRVAKVLALRLAQTTQELVESKEWFLQQHAVVGR